MGKFKSGFLPSSIADLMGSALHKILRKSLSQGHWPIGKPWASSSPSAASASSPGTSAPFRNMSRERIRKASCLLGVPGCSHMECLCPPQSRVIPGRCQSTPRPPSTLPPLTSVSWESSSQARPSTSGIIWVGNKDSDLVS